MRKGYIIGPFDQSPFDQYRISPIGVVDKKYSTKKRLIVDLSALHNSNVNPSINDLIDKDEFSLSYVRIDDAIRIIVEKGRGAQLCKTDIVDAFKLMPILPSLWPYYGIRWRDKFYFYVRLAFGSRSSPKIVDALSSAICWIAVHNYGINHFLHLLDDFLSIDSPDADAERTMALITFIFNTLNVPIAPHKTEGPATELEYLGIILDTFNMQARLPEDKLIRIVTMVEKFLNCKKCTKREFLSVLGHLQFASRVVVPGRSFISRLLDAARGVRELHHFVTLNNQCKEYNTRRLKDVAYLPLTLEWGVSISRRVMHCST